MNDKTTAGSVETGLVLRVKGVGEPSVLHKKHKKTAHVLPGCVVKRSVIRQVVAVAPTAVANGEGWVHLELGIHTGA